MKKLLLILLLGAFVRCNAQFTSFVAASNNQRPIAKDANVQCVLDYARSQGIGLPSTSTIIKLHNLVITLKSLGVWSMADAVYITRTDGSKEFATLNIKNPLVNRWVLVNTPTFTSNLGFTFDGASTYASTTFVPSVDGVNWTLGSASIFFSNEVDTGGSNTYDMSAINDNYVITNNAGNAMQFLINGAGSAAAISGTKGRFLLNRISTTQVNAYFEGAKILASTTSNAVSLGNYPIYIGGQDNAYNAELFRGTTIGVLILGGNLESYSTGLLNAWKVYCN